MLESDRDAVGTVRRLDVRVREVKMQKLLESRMSVRASSWVSGKRSCLPSCCH